MKKLNTLTLRLLVAVLIIGGVKVQALAQTRPAPDVQQWPVGEVILATGDTLHGPITYYQTEDVINVKQKDGSFRALSPVNVDHFKVQETPDTYTRFFVTYDWDLNKSYSDFKKPTFFERMNKGDLTLIIREASSQRDLSNRGFLGRNSFHEAVYKTGVPQYVQQMVPSYYVLFPDGEIKILRNIKRDLQRIFGRKADTVNQFAREHRLSYDKLHGVIAIINYYNSLP